MKRPLFAVLLLGLAFNAGVAADQTQDDLKGLQGTWIPTTAEAAGKKAPDETLKDVKLIIKGEGYSTKVGDVTDEGTIKLNGAKTPKTMDIMGTEGPNKGKTILAIYELASDGLKVCYALEGERPTAFKTEAGAKLLLITYRREKP